MPWRKDRGTRIGRHIGINSKRGLFISVILAAAGLGLAPLAKKTALTSGAEPLVVAIAAVSTAAVIAMALLLYTVPARNLLGYPARTYLHVLLVGTMGSGAVVLLSVYAMMETTATNRSLFQSMYPAATAVAARLMLAERLGAATYLIIAAMSGGLFLMNTGPEGLRIGLSFWLLAATLPLISLADVYAKRTLNAAHPGFVVTGRLLFGMLALLVALPLTSASDWAAAFDLWPWLVGAGAATAAGVLGLYRTMDKAGAGLAASFVALAPVITVVSEGIILDQDFSNLQLAGIVTVVAGAAALARRL